MSIERFGSVYILTCDNCGNKHEKSFFEFDEAVQAKKDDGWKSSKVNGQWEDWCSDCVEMERG